MLFGRAGGDFFPVLPQKGDLWDNRVRSEKRLVGLLLSNLRIRPGFTRRRATDVAADIPTTHPSDGGEAGDAELTSPNVTCTGLMPRSLN